MPVCAQLTFYLFLYKTEAQGIVPPTAGSSSHFSEHNQDNPPLDMPAGQANLDNPSLRLSSPVILGYIKLTN